jgi:hypothetical protein
MIVGTTEDDPERLVMGHSQTHANTFFVGRKEEMGEKKKWKEEEEIRVRISCCRVYFFFFFFCTFFFPLCEVSACKKWAKNPSFLP